MALANIFVLFTLCLASSLADTNVTEYIYWKTQDIIEWHLYFPSRALEEEQQTNEAAVAAVSSLSSSLEQSLSSIVAFQAQELEVAELLMNGTSAQGCVLGIADYMTDAIQDEISTYEDCAADAYSNLQRLNTSWAKTKTTYLAAYQRALTGIQVCAKTYPNKDSIARLISCVEAMNKNYFTAANSTVAAMYPSPSMTYFQNTVVDCATTAANDVTSKGYQFLDMLVECAVLSGGVVDPTTYQEELDQWTGYNATLSSQIVAAQAENDNQVSVVESGIQSYYNLQKNMLETYVIESRGFSYYLNMIYTYLADYYNTVTETSVDNPGDPTCTSDAQTTLNNVAYLGATKALACDLDIVNNTKYLITDVTSHFSVLNNKMPGIGNAAILNCFSQGYVFAPDTIIDCFDLVYAQFNVDYEDNDAVISQDVSVLTGYEPFYGGEALPCGGTSMQRVLLGADQALYDLQRCLYITSGTNYFVTTPVPSTTTTNATTTSYASTTASSTTTTTSATTASSSTTTTSAPTVSSTTTPA